VSDILDLRYLPMTFSQNLTGGKERIPDSPHNAILFLVAASPRHAKLARRKASELGANLPPSSFIILNNLNSG
jgi:hypothetical protein